VLYLAFAEFVEKRSPLGVLFEIIGHALGKKDVTCVTAVHYPLGDVYSSAGDVRLFVKIGYFIDRSAMDSHSQP